MSTGNEQVELIDITGDMTKLQQQGVPHFVDMDISEYLVDMFRMNCIFLKSMTPLELSREEEDRVRYRLLQKELLTQTPKPLSAWLNLQYLIPLNKDLYEIAKRRRLDNNDESIEDLTIEDISDDVCAVITNGSNNPVNHPIWAKQYFTGDYSRLLESMYTSSSTVFNGSTIANAVAGLPDELAPYLIMPIVNKEDE